MPGTMTAVIRVVAVLLVVAGLAGWVLHASSQVPTRDHKITLTLWYWNRSIDDTILAQVPRAFPNVRLVAEKIGGDYNAKLRTTLAGQTDVPDIVGLNSDISTFFPDESQFANLLDLGAGAVKHDYLGWKWEAGIAPDGRMIGFPMDTGPTALFYRADLFRKAGLPSDPAQVAAHLATWPAYFRAGKKLQAALPGVHMLDSISTVFTQVMAQSPQQFMDPAGHFIGDQGAVKRAWDLAVAAHNMRVSAALQGFTTNWNAAVDNGAVASFVGAVWMKDILEQAAPDTAGKWRVARAPGGAGNNGGSFLAVTSDSAHPRLAFAVIKWLQSPAHQLQAYQDIALFPSAPADFASPRMNQHESFFGGQNTTPVFATSAKNVQPEYFSPNYDIINTVFQQQITDIDTQNKDPNRALAAALQQTHRDLSH